MSVHLVPDGLAGERVDSAVARMTGLSRSRVDELIAQGLVQIDGRAVRKSVRVAGGELLEVTLPAQPSGVPVVPLELCRRTTSRLSAASMPQG